MTYTIQELAQANECETRDMFGLADIWLYWYTNNCCETSSIQDFLSLNNEGRIAMLRYLQSDGVYEELFLHILPHIYD